jgi:hypothetical protein
VILDTYARSTKTFRAVLILAGQAYGEQAGMLNRSLFEDMIVAHWLRKHPNEAAKLERHRLLQIELVREDAHRLGRLDYLEDMPQPLPREARERLAAEFAGARHWTGKSLDELLNDVRGEWADPRDQRLLDQVHAFDHRSNNLLLHHSSAGLAAQRVDVEEGPGVRGHNIGASWINVRDGLASAFFSYSNMVSLVLDSQRRDALEKLYGEHLGAFVTVGEATNDSSRG